MRETASPGVPIRSLILVPSVITLAITLLRLAGELQNWSPTLFSRQAGGGGALIGISWLVPVFGMYFAVRLVKLGFRPASYGQLYGRALGAFALVLLLGFGVFKAGASPLVGLVTFAVASIVAVVIALPAWPALGRTLLAYAFAARVPVAIVMLFAIFGNWGTHYDVSPPDASAVDQLTPLMKWVEIGLLPQMTIWIYVTVVGGLLFGGIAAAVAGRNR
jgi:hypothetical protein